MKVVTRYRLSRLVISGLSLSVMFAVASCGGGGDAPSGTPSGGSGAGSGGGTSSAVNVVPVIVDSGPGANVTEYNTLYTTVTVCVPGSTTQCQTIDHIQVDTGSSGLRIISSVLALTLPGSAAPNGNTLAECTQFADGYSWGPIATADVQVGGEAASSVPVQIIGEPNFSAVPAACSGTGTAEDTVAAFGANGILGIGFFDQDCGTGCAANTGNTFYYSCSSAAGCAQSAAPLTSQVLNPVALFAVNNNGTIIDLPAVPGTGAATVTGTLTFGIDTQTNNASGTQIILTVDPASGQFTTVYAGQSLTASFIDSGTNGIFFNDSSITPCTSAKNFYCPAATLTLTATLTGQNGVSAPETFLVGNAETLTSSEPAFAAFPSLAGNYTASTTTFDWGLPFFYGRRVATALENATTAVDTGPYVAF